MISIPVAAADKLSQLLLLIFDVSSRLGLDLAEYGVI